MGVLRPGGTELTRYALDRCGVSEKDCILDIGCGDGTAAAFILEHYPVSVTAVDKDEEAVEKAKSKGVDAQVADAEALPFASRGFDIVLMECVFSILNRQEEAIHEAFCMIRPGGHLVITDVYCREPDMDRFREEYASAMAVIRRPREDGECVGEDEKFPSPYCQDGAVVPESLEGLLEELGMKVVLFEDRTDDLKAFCAQAILDYGSVEEYLQKEGTWQGCGLNCRKPGYFLLIAEKS